MTGLRGLGHLECAASASFVPEEDRLRAARGEKGLSRDVCAEGDPILDSTMRGWVDNLTRQQQAEDSVE